MNHLEDLLRRLPAGQRIKLGRVAAELIAEGGGVDRRNRPGGDQLVSAIVVAAALDLIAIEQAEADALSFLHQASVAADPWTDICDAGVIVRLDADGEIIDVVDLAATPGE